MSVVIDTPRPAVVIDHDDRVMICSDVTSGVFGSSGLPSVPVPRMRIRVFGKVENEFFLDITRVQELHELCKTIMASVAGDALKDEPL